jgi:hypothetical protein
VSDIGHPLWCTQASRCTADHPDGQHKGDLIQVGDDPTAPLVMAFLRQRTAAEPVAVVWQGPDGCHAEWSADDLDRVAAVYTELAADLRTGVPRGSSEVV